jgi:hypothetical protein
MREGSSWLRRSLWSGVLGVTLSCAVFPGCRFLGLYNGNPPSTSTALVKTEVNSITLKVGESQLVGWEAVAGEAVFEPIRCGGVAQVEAAEKEPWKEALLIRGLAPGGCFVILDAVPPEGEAKEKIFPIVVRSPEEPAPPPDAGDAAGDAGGVTEQDAGADASPPLCTVPVGKVGAIDGRDLYMAYTDLDTGPANPACPIYTSTNEMGDVTFGFLAGSPGYRIDGRGTYEILSATPAILENTGYSSSAIALEDQTITITFRRRVFEDEDASVPPPTWMMTFLMRSNPDPAKWAIELYSFSRQ